MGTDVEALAARFFDALQAADVEALKALYAPDATMWMNTTGRTRPAREVLPFLPGMARRMPDRAYVDRRLTLTPDGFVQRYRLTGTRKDGARVAVDCCVICQVAEGRIARLEEYCDSRQLNALMA